MTHVKHRKKHKNTSKQIVVEPCQEPYHGPYGAHPLTHVGYLEGRHLHPRRLPTSNGQRAVSLRLLDTSKETIDNVQQLTETLRRLQLGGLKLKKVPETLVARLSNLKKLDLGENELGDSSFPETMTDLEGLIEIRLNDNKLTRFPACLKKLKNLCRLDMSNNRLESVVGLEKLRKVQVLVLDNNKLTSVIKEISNLKRLEILRCSDNKIKELTHEIRNLQALVDIDVSNNKLTVLNTELFMLPKLEFLNASHNNISKIPSFNIKPHQKHWISCLDISENNLTKFPGHLMLMSHQLDISSNKIKVLSWNVIKKLDTEVDQELDLGGNPLIYPPAAVCENGLRSVTQFFQESQLDAKVYQGIKILVLGSHRSGKSSLVHSLVDQQARLVREIDEESAVIGVYETSFDYDLVDGRPNKFLQLCVWDFCGHPFYCYPHYVFFEQSAITILTFNMAAYKEELFYEMVGSWFDWMIAKNNKLVVLLVATHSDLVPQEQTKVICDSVCTQLTQHMEKGKNMIEQRIRRIEQHSYISPTLSEQLKSYVFLLRSKFTVQTNIILTSSAKYKGFDVLTRAIETLSNDVKLFPNVMRVIPTFWVQVETYLEERGIAMAVPVMKWYEYRDEVVGKFGMKHLLNDLTEYLHETGKVIWFSKVQGLKDYVILRPAWLFDVLKLVYRHDAEDTLTYTHDDNFKTVGISQVKFDRMKRDYVTEGILDREFFKGMLLPQLSTTNINLGSQIEKVMNLLLEAFQIGYQVIKRPKDTFTTFSLDQDKLEEDREKEKSKKYVQYLIPWIRKTSEPSDMIEKWESISNRRRVVIRYVFPRYLPLGIFELMCTRAHGEQFNLKFLAHWYGGVHAVHRQQTIRLVMRCLQEEDGSTIIKFDLRDDTEGEDEVPAATMWTLLLPLLTEFDALLKNFTGIWVEKFVECPQCHEPSFPGEWTTPKETQALPTKLCDLCGENVDTALLVQPKTKNKDDVLLSIRNKKARYRRAAVTTDMQVEENISKISPNSRKPKEFSTPDG
ncbi:malignant fibrous histiocytoma-amplified sequence 1 homolog isoform X1 [Patella vulgata]|uniref:malignant fibrous histiocytoma-amplified sequence 1 homolog isoform X1 n=1 Tax=Patella vulgata TaxID=6465 RepID=UPI0024A8D5F1|nr:malignant fibrous histiocytoma-amplified sequence 1 homolog isoform X1 [Patella vulgata]XP_050413656.2 malignant fibrous histiocytoma-amplified sequence 1 homolog isoform X1 [Patella vulgata]XP_050413664.2 malignant fibrous histiocytoma-amplified sequence 1 homolog isoform X1 [Patella vulgata]XP_050413671.2 malignant fibrous histiocytoma-amplified sequence 1 homolog isoform X1 [Patella vulgata]